LKARVVLVAELVDSLSINDVDWLLQGEFLFLPDLDVWQSTFGDDYRLKYRLRDVLEERELKRRPTIVYMERADRSDFCNLFERYRKANLVKVIPRAHDVTWDKA
jgi:hypothetical protein